MNNKKVYSETYATLLALGEEQINRLPADVFELIKKESLEMYMPRIDAEKPLSEQGLSEEALAMIALLRLEYWCDSDEEKEEFRQYLQTNEQKLEEILMNTTSTRELLRLIRKNR
ncbi:MAG: hypothetical protein FWE47_00915 [Oscillospiraceae bacterium]|nr:hypothetical protein [Oscillospiraceae bacterium]